MQSKEKGFVTILTGVYAFQDCIHFLSSVRKFHQDPILILIDRVPKFLTPLLQGFGNVILKESPADENPVLAARKAKVALYNESPFEKTIFMDNDICLLSNIDEVFSYLDKFDLLVTKDVRPFITDASNLLRVKQDLETKYDVLPVLQSVGLLLTEGSVQYNSGMIAFRKKYNNKILFDKYKEYLELIIKNQDILLLRDQGAFAAAIEFVKPSLKVLPPNYNYLTMYKDFYEGIYEPIKVLHCTYIHRPQYAKNITKSIYMRVFDRLAKLFLPSRNKNPWRRKKANY